MIVSERIAKETHTVIVYDNGGVHIERDNGSHCYMTPEELETVKQLLTDADNV